MIADKYKAVADANILAIIVVILMRYTDMGGNQ